MDKLIQCICVNNLQNKFSNAEKIIEIDKQKPGRDYIKFYEGDKFIFYKNNKDNIIKYFNKPNY